MTLQDRLDAYKKTFEKTAPKEALDIMHNATEALASSGQVENATAVGDRAPDFSLKDTAGRDVSLSGLLVNGPLVLTFYRGKW